MIAFTLSIHYSLCLLDGQETKGIVYAKGYFRSPLVFCGQTSMQIAKTIL